MFCVSLEIGFTAQHAQHIELLTIVNVTGCTYLFKTPSIFHKLMRILLFYWQRLHFRLVLTSCVIQRHHREPTFSSWILRQLLHSISLRVAGMCREFLCEGALKCELSMRYMRAYMYAANTRGVDASVWGIGESVPATRQAKGRLIYRPQIRKQTSLQQLTFYFALQLKSSLFIF